MKSNFFKSVLLLSTLIVCFSDVQAQKCIFGNCDNGYGIWVSKDETQIYFGEFKDGNFSGHGTYLVKDHDLYVGNFINGNYNLKGSMYFPNGHEYTGFFLEDKRHGLGKYTYADGTTENVWSQNGQYIENQRPSGFVYNRLSNEGFEYVQYVYSDGNIYEGEFGKKFPEGYGTMYYADGEEYSGYWVKGGWKGYGKYTKADGSELEGFFDYGDFISNLNNYKGLVYGEEKYGIVYSVKITDEGIIKGYLPNGVPNGPCEFFSSDGQTKMSGNFVNGAFTGFGEILHSEESSYNASKIVGEFTNGEVNGKAIVWFQDGNVYWGTFVNDKFASGIYGHYDPKTGVRDCQIYQSGQYIQTIDYQDKCGEIFTSQDGSFGIRYFELGIYYGDLENGVPHGNGYCELHNGLKYYGNFHEGVISGYGILFSSSESYRGYLLDGSLHGEGVLKKADGTIQKGYFEKGEFVGDKKVYNRFQAIDQQSDNQNQGEEGRENQHTNVAAPQVAWNAPASLSSEQSSKMTKIKLCVTSEVPLDDIKVYLNNNVVVKTMTRGFKVVDAGCDYPLEYDIELQPGENEIYAEITNIGGTTKTDVRKINYVLNQSNIDNKARIALIIGNKEYNACQLLTPLRNSTNDANLMDKTLKELGFETILLIDGTRDQIRAKIREFRNRLEETGAVGLFYYAGHGLEFNKTNYFIPVDAVINDGADVPNTCVSLDMLTQALVSAANDMNIIILDACRQNIFSKTRGSGDNDGGLGKVDAPQGTYIAYATAQGSTASDGVGENGLFTEELVKQISVKGQRLEDVFQEVRRNVYEKSGHTQKTWDSSSFYGKFYFSK